MQCPACNEQIDKVDRRCLSCGWGVDRKPKAEQGDENDVYAFQQEEIEEIDDPYDIEESERPKRKKKKRRQDPPIDYGSIVGLIFLPIVGLVFGWLAMSSPDWGIVMVFVGLSSTCITAFVLYAQASKDGIDRPDLLSSMPRGLISLMLLFLIEIIILPIFCLIYLLASFGSAWRPVLNCIISLVITATAIVLLVKR